MKSFLMRFRHDFLRALPVLICGVIIAWCSFYLLFGTSSIFVLRTLKVQEAQLEQTHDTLVADRTQVEDRVVRMRPNSLDWDLVEEQALLQLGASPEAKALKM
ncbi:MAG: hypothetical protein KGQ41_07420 [Alphaproteobacteria bacterium]|nr:hypothetical protein [Alphaproteobacteria bacterium]